MRVIGFLYSLCLGSLLIVAPLAGQVQLSDTTSDATVPSLELHETNTADAAASGVIAVRVTDEKGAAVPDATVVFHLPDSGPSGTFRDGALSAVAYTDSSGSARVEQIHWGETTGHVPVRITAAKGAAHAGLLLDKAVARVPAPAALAGATVNVSTPSGPRTSKAPLTPSSPKSDEAADRAVALNRVPGSLPATATDSPGAVIEHRSASRRKADVVADVDQAPIAAPVLNNDSPYANVPIRHLLTSDADGELSAPHVSVRTSGESAEPHRSRKKWIIAAVAIAAAAGAGTALALAHGGGSSSSSSGVTVGPPVISVGHP